MVFNCKSVNLLCLRLFERKNIWKISVLSANDSLFEIGGMNLAALAPFKMGWGGVGEGL
jgi:hypothetical protein